MLAVMDCRAPDALKNALECRGLEVCPLPVCPTLPLSVAAHPDMLVFFAQDAVISSRYYYEECAGEAIDCICRAAGKSLLLSEQIPGNSYPSDVLFNAATVGEHLFCRLDAADPLLLKSVPKARLCNVAQGYSKCSTLPVSDTALITEDPSIARAADAAGLEVLFLNTKEVTLPGYDVGFIGGASSFFPYQKSDQIFFSGALEHHSQAQKITAFCMAHGREPISLTDLPLFDVGTIFFI